MRVAGLFLLVIVVWWWWQQEPGLKARGSQEPRVRLGPLRQMASGQGRLPLWAPPLPSWDSVVGGDSAPTPPSRHGAWVSREGCSLS